MRLFSGISASTVLMCSSIFYSKSIFGCFVWITSSWDDLLQHLAGSSCQLGDGTYCPMSEDIVDQNPIMYHHFPSFSLWICQFGDIHGYTPFLDTPGTQYIHRTLGELRPPVICRLSVATSASLYIKHLGSPVLRRPHEGLGEGGALPAQPGWSWREMRNVGIHRIHSWCLEIIYNFWRSWSWSMMIILDHPLRPSCLDVLS